MTRTYFSYFMLAVTLTAASAVMQGKLVGRWTSRRVTAELEQELAGLPTAAGRWQLVETRNLPTESVKMLQCSAHQYRTYQDADTGVRMDVIITLGPPGPTSVHTPEVCYPSQNYKTTTERSRVIVAHDEQRDDSRSDEFWRVTFETNDVAAQDVHVYYGWSQGDRWQAPDQPRFHFSGSPWLYKLQLSSVGTPLSTHAECERFLRDFLPVLQQHLGTSEQRSSKRADI